MVEESQKRKKHSEANLYVVPYGRYNLMETMPLSMMKALDEDVPPVFMILDTFDRDVKSLLPGTHLFCIYGDNWFQSVKYSLKCLVAVDPSTQCVMDIKRTEDKLQEKKRHLENFQVRRRRRRRLHTFSMENPQGLGLSFEVIMSGWS